MVREGSASPQWALGVARRAIQVHYPKAFYAYACGSAATGRYRPYSDIDVIVILEASLHYEQRCLIFEGAPIDFQTMGKDAAPSVAAHARRSGFAASIEALAGGEIIVDTDGGAAALRQMMRDAIDAGREPAAPIMIDVLRNVITNLLLDLCGADDPAEIIACGLALYYPLMNLLTPKDTGWLHAGKMIARRLKASDSDVFDRVVVAYRDLMEGRPDGVMLLTEEVLDRWGGPLWDGYVQRGPIRAA